jgi:hypothetical protein
MSPRPSEKSSETVRAAWALMTDLVVNNERRRQVSDALGMSFTRTRAIRRVAKGPMPMGESPRRSA